MSKRPLRHTHLLLKLPRLGTHIMGSLGGLVGSVEILLDGDNLVLEKLARVLLSVRF